MDGVGNKEVFGWSGMAKNAVQVNCEVAEWMKRWCGHVIWSLEEREVK